MIRPAFQRYRDALANELLPAARSDDRCGLSWLDDGPAIYRALIHHHTTLESGTGQSIAPFVLGLGDAELVPLIRLRWPDGVMQTELNQAADVTLTLAEKNRVPFSVEDNVQGVAKGADTTFSKQFAIYRPVAE